MTQKEAVLKHLKAFGSITSWEAIKEYGCTRLADVIFRLRKEGYIIHSSNITTKNRFGDNTHFSKYTLIEA